jgi:hypothetical protein
MPKKIAAVVMLGILGLVVGISVTYGGGYRYKVVSTLVLPDRNSPHSAAELVAMTSGHHPGAHLMPLARRNSVRMFATGTFDGAEHAIFRAYSELVASNDHKFKSFFPSYGGAWREGLLRRNYGFVGLLAGLSVGLGFLVPPRSPAVRCATCSQVIPRPRRERRIAMPISLAITGGIVVFTVILVLAALVFAFISRQYTPSLGGGL